jgi:phosphopantetheinyl transferase
VQGWGAMSSRSPQLPRGRVEVWWARLDSPEARESDHLDDLEEAGQITGTNRRRALLVRRAILRELLGHYLGCGAEAVELRRHSRATRPYVAGFPDLSFSVACRGPTAVFAFACGRAVGVDFERTDTLDRHGPLPEIFLSRTERRRISGVTEPNRGLALLRRWTLKEASVDSQGGNSQRNGPRNAARLRGHRSLPFARTALPRAY